MWDREGMEMLAAVRRASKLWRPTARGSMFATTREEIEPLRGQVRRRSDGPLEVDSTYPATTSRAAERRCRAGRRSPLDEVIARPPTRRFTASWCAGVVHAAGESLGTRATRPESHRSP
jgi:hypothetical protein